MKNTLLWALAFIITAFSAVYQRMTGPTYPLKGSFEFEGYSVSFRLPRSHEIGSDLTIDIETNSEEMKGLVSFRRYKTQDPWQKVIMVKENNELTAGLPSEPAAGKLEYRVILELNGKTASLTGKNTVVIRFKGAVPGFVLFPHILIMFSAMLLSTRTGLEALRKGKNPRKMVLWTFGLLLSGGMILGPLVQYYAFGSFWTGFPFGTDLTDNKTLLIIFAWIAAVIAGRKGKSARGWVISASVLTLAVYFIPHSLMGSELDYSQATVNTSEGIIPGMKP